ncbi:MAG: hypothetical protein JO333_00180 [Verrucomicrobia bacterium]|nr:hypothetical protein [Verrucomicrobiota bacterium]
MVKNCYAPIRIDPCQASIPDDPKSTSPVHEQVTQHTSRKTVLFQESLLDVSRAIKEYQSTPLNPNHK